MHIYNIVKSLRKAATLANVSHSTIARWVKFGVGRKNYTFQKRPPWQKASDDMVSLLRATIDSNPFVSVRQLQSMISTALNIKVSRELVRVAIKRQGLTKKAARFYGVTTKLPDQTKDFLSRRAQFMAEGRTFASVDETSFGRHGRVVRGYAPRGMPLHMRKKQARVTTISVVACVAADGMVSKTHVPGSFNNQKFAAFLDLHGHFRA